MDFFNLETIGQIICLVRYVFFCQLVFLSSFLTIPKKSSKPLSLNLCVDLNSNSIMSASSLLTGQVGYNGILSSFLIISSFLNCL
jgi:hypothetical protein